MDRMAARSRAPEVLREIFAALRSDPFVIAETLARQTLADRLIRNWYARDERFHGDLRRRAEAALAGLSSSAGLSSLGAEYSETTWRLRGTDEPDKVEADDDMRMGSRPRVIVLDAEAWTVRLEQLAALIGSRRGSSRAEGPIEDLEGFPGTSLDPAGAIQPGSGAERSRRRTRSGGVSMRCR